MTDEQIKAAASALKEGLEGFPALVEKHLDASGMSQTRYSLEAYGSVDFVRLLRAGRNFRLDTLVKVATFMAREEIPSPSTNVA